MLLRRHCGGWQTTWQTKRLPSCEGKRERELDTDMASGIAGRSRDVYAAVEWTDFYSGFKEVLLDDRISQADAYCSADKSSVLGL